MPPVPVATRRARAAALRALAAGPAFFAAMDGRRVAVLAETDRAGHSEHFAPVRLTAPAAPGQVIAARVVAADAAGVTATPI
jgi:threonylcarbamoyladenosine tRNA methylthiotransferase MtaB